MVEIGADIHKAATILQKGGLVAVPTETVYGLAANALDRSAVLRVFEAKKRPGFDPLIVHSTKEKIFQWVREVPENAVRLADQFWPGPLTLVLPKAEIIPYEVTSGLDTVGVRVPRHPLTEQLLQMLPFPLAAPSANPFGYISPTTAQHVADQLGEQVDYILDGGPCQVGIESTIIGFEAGETVAYRLGGIPLESIEAITGPLKIKMISSSDPRAPGMLKSHYAPLTPLELVDYVSQEKDSAETGYLLFHQQIKGIDSNRQFFLSDKGDLFVAAARLYAMLRLLDKKGFQKIVVEKLPEEGLGRAINDRLRRAAAK
jgi:L-threonylcarbamoyladenylate synthase